jgi:hypothetical protein
MSQIKIQVLAIGELETGKGRTGTDWYRRNLQCFTGEVVGQIPYYAEKEELERMQAGSYMVDVTPRAGDRGRLEFAIGKATAVNAPKATPAA